MIRDESKGGGIFFKMREDPVGEMSDILRHMMIVGKVELLANNSSEKKSF